MGAASAVGFFDEDFLLRVHLAIKEAPDGGGAGFTQTCGAFADEAALKLRHAR